MPLLRASQVCLLVSACFAEPFDVDFSTDSDDIHLLQKSLAPHAGGKDAMHVGCSHAGSKSLQSLAKAQALLQSNGSTVTKLTETEKTNCLANTGGTCLAFKCQKFRGPTHCDGVRCLCKSGYCSGANGECSAHAYRIVLDDATLRNVRYNDSLYASSFGWHLGVSTKLNKQSRFVLMETHDGHYILYSKAYPEYAIAVTEQPPDHNSYRPSFSAHQVNALGNQINQLGLSPAVSHIALTLTAPPSGYSDDQRSNGTYPVMLQSYEYSRQYIYVSGASVFGIVGVSDDDPGDGALWEFDPPLPKDVLARLQKYTGQRCSFNCHGDDSVWKQPVVFIILGVVVAVLLCFCCGPCGLGVLTEAGGFGAVTAWGD